MMFRVLEDGIRAQILHNGVPVDTFRTLAEAATFAYSWGLGFDRTAAQRRAQSFQLGDSLVKPLSGEEITVIAV